MVDSEVFSSPVIVSSCVVRNGGRDGEGLVSFARDLGESHWRHGDSDLAALPSKSLRWSACISSLIFRCHGSLVRQEMAPRSGSKGNVYICDNKHMARQPSCGQIHARATTLQGPNQGRGTTSGDEKISCRAGRNGQLRSIPKTPLAVGREKFRHGC